MDEIEHLMKARWAGWSVDQSLILAGDCCAVAQTDFVKRRVDRGRAGRKLGMPGGLEC
jgi:hypothetical protein